MNFTKKNKIIMGVTAGVIAIAVIVTAVLLTGGNVTPPVTDNPDAGNSSSDVVVNLPTDDPSGTGSTDPTGKEKDEPLVIDVSGNPENPTGTGNNGSNSNSAKTPEKSVDTKKPEPPADNKNGGGIEIGGDDHDHTPYICGSPNHHCKNAEAHAYIQNLELEGCPFCGSHSCPSFYGTDEWGNSGLFPKLCPKYDIKKDPLYYCQDCGKKIGDGKNDTCTQFINACNCPICGEYVPARTCHTCK